LLAGYFFLRVERDDEAAVAVHVHQVNQCGAIVDFGVFTQLGGGTQLQGVVTFHYQKTHRAVAMDLHHHGAVELQVGRQQGCGGHHFTEHALDRGGVVAPRQHLAPGVG
jgi:hypothetical protein